MSKNSKVRDFIHTVALKGFFFISKNSVVSYVLSYVPNFELKFFLNLWVYVCELFQWIRSRHKIQHILFGNIWWSVQLWRKHKNIVNSREGKSFSRKKFFLSKIQNSFFLNIRWDTTQNVNFGNSIITLYRFETVLWKLFTL
jgi:hypothetical protein